MKPFDLGYHSFFKSFSLADCPFPEDSDDELAWYKGWLAGEMDWESSCEGDYEA